MAQGEGVVALMILAVAAVLALAFLILLIPLIIWLTRRGTNGSKVADASAQWPTSARRLMSEPEQILYHRLTEALPGKLIFPQVQLSRILEVKNVPNRMAWLNRIIRLSADFVICNPDSSVVAVIELDDASHNRARTQDADARKNEALAAAGVQLIRWRVSEMPGVEQIRDQLLRTQ